MKLAEGRFAYELVGAGAASLMGSVGGNCAVATAGGRAAERRTKRQGGD